MFECLYIDIYLVRWGRRILEHTSAKDSPMSESDRQRVEEILSPAMGEESSDLQYKVEEMCSLLTNWRPGQDPDEEEEEEDLRLEEVQGTHQVGVLNPSYIAPSHLLSLRLFSYVMAVKKQQCFICRSLEFTIFFKEKEQNEKLELRQKYI